MLPRLGVVVGVAVLAGIEVHDDRVEPAHLVEQRVPHRLGDIVPWATVSWQSTTRSVLAMRRWPIQRTRTVSTSMTPSTPPATRSMSATSPGSTASMSRRNTARAASLRIHRMATVMTSPMMGSASGKPSHTPIAAMTTAIEVSPSVRACRPSAMSACEPISWPTRMR